MQPGTAAYHGGWAGARKSLTARQDQQRPFSIAGPCARRRKADHRVGYDGGKHKKGSELHMAVDTLGHLLPLHVTPANRDDRAAAGCLAAAIRMATDDSVEQAYVDLGHIGKKPVEAARVHDITFEVMRLSKARRGCVRLTRRWVVERSFACVTGRRRVITDCGRYASAFAGCNIQVPFVPAARHCCKIFGNLPAS
ncbi:transposase [Komagataeibacter europaeus]|uniref:transposase n=1 Tax=Komagataeibacter europaeus TaxID=33995 RepID=UPI0009E5C70D|nr:transposase [Komagataeibacter europaeus]